jgi:hypothetical protein
LEHCTSRPAKGMTPASTSYSASQLGQTRRIGIPYQSREAAIFYLVATKALISKRL